LRGNDGYPYKDRGNYCIAGGFDFNFKAIAIEIRGVNRRGF